MFTRVRAAAAAVACAGWVAAAAGAAAVAGPAVATRGPGRPPLAYGPGGAAAPAAVFRGGLLGVAATSGRNAWAVGIGSSPLDVHWNGVTWKRVPRVPLSWLAGVAATSARDAWAVGFTDYPQPLIARWTGTAWKAAYAPVYDGILWGVAALSARNVWAVGTSNLPPSSVVGRTLIVHWNGTGWKRVPSPDPGSRCSLSNVAALSARDIWAIGVTDTRAGQRSLVQHWNGAAWKTMLIPGLGPHASLLGIAGTSPRNLWLAGTAAGKTLILHFNGTSWRRVPSPDPGGGRLTAIAAISARDAWAAGTTRSGRELLLHWNGTTWHLARAPEPAGSAYFSGVAAASARNIWAVGGHRPPGTALILHFNGTRWNSSPGMHPARPAANLGRATRERSDLDLVVRASELPRRFVRYSLAPATARSSGPACAAFGRGRCWSLVRCWSDRRLAGQAAGCRGRRRGSCWRCLVWPDLCRGVPGKGASVAGTARFPGAGVNQLAVPGVDLERPAVQVWDGLATN